MKRCTKCGNDKDENEFQTKPSWRKLASGKVKRYAPKPISICRTCVKIRDRVQEKKYILLLSVCNPKLHQRELKRVAKL